MKILGCEGRMVCWVKCQLVNEEITERIELLYKRVAQHGLCSI